MDRVYNDKKNYKGKAGDAADGLDVLRKQGQSKQVVFLESCYNAVRHADDPEVEQVIGALRKEMEKERPWKDVVLWLMKSTVWKMQAIHLV